MPLTHADRDRAGEARTLAQSDPVPNITANYTQHYLDAQRHLDALVTSLRYLDVCADALQEHGMKVDVDLGPIGNAAAAARRDLERQRDTPEFRMPEAG